MKTMIPLTGALVLALAAPTLATAQEGKGKGPEGPRAERGPGPDRGSRNEERGRPDRSGPQRVERQERAPDRAPRPPEVREVVRRAEVRGPDGWRPDDRKRLDEARRDWERTEDRARRDWERERRDWDRNWDRVLIVGCPPGLAKRDNGCVPPGQARRIAERRANWDYLWDRRDDYRYRYDDGYLYRYNTGGSLLGYLPVLGGALFTGNPWPTQYAYEPAPAYYTDYYRLNDGYDYRYADGVLYQTDRGNSSISQIAALLTGQQWNVGQRMPAGYDVYNVPYGYRDRYYDSADSLYRYNDGYVYQVDPTTQLVQAVIQLIT